VDFLHSSDVTLYIIMLPFNSGRLVMIWFSSGSILRIRVHSLGWSQGRGIRPGEFIPRASLGQD